MAWYYRGMTATGSPLGGHPGRPRAAPCIFHGQRGVPLSRAVVRGAALQPCRRARRRLAAHRFGRCDLRVWRRPWRVLIDNDRRVRILILGLGVTLALMNSAFYLGYRPHAAGDRRRDRVRRHYRRRADRRPNAPECRRPDDRGHGRLFADRLSMVRRSPRHASSPSSTRSCLEFTSSSVTRFRAPAARAGSTCWARRCSSR